MSKFHPFISPFLMGMIPIFGFMFGLHIGKATDITNVQYKIEQIVACGPEECVYNASSVQTGEAKELRSINLYTVGTFVYFTTYTKFGSPRFRVSLSPKE